MLEHQKCHATTLQNKYHATKECQNARDYCSYLLTTLDKIELYLIHISKRECIAIHSWCWIEWVMRQQLIGYLKHTQKIIIVEMMEFFSVVEIPIKHSSWYNKFWKFDLVYIEHI